MCIGRAWEVGRFRSGIRCMEDIRLSTRVRIGLAVAADMLDHRGKIGLQADENLGYLVQAPFDSIQARHRRFAVACNWLAGGWRPPSVEDRVKVLGLPAECHGQRFQSSRATVALNGVTLNFAHDGGRYMRALRKFTLTPSKLDHALIDGLSNCCPIFRHPFPPRSAFGAEVSRSSSFCGPIQGFARRDLRCKSVNRAEIIEISLKSATTLLATASHAPGRRTIS